MFDRILVPQGAEAAAVKRGLKRAKVNTEIVPIAMGPQATTRRLTTALDKGEVTSGSRLLVLGVAGSLSAQLGVGDVIIYDSFVTLDAEATDASKTDAGITDANNPRTASAISDRTKISQLCSIELKARLPTAAVITALSSDRLIHSTQEKAQLQATTGAQAVDMEAAAIQTSLSPQNIQLSTVRVISDDLDMDLPNIEVAINEAGGLDGLKMAIAMVSQPRASLNLIRGSLKALKVLEDVTYKIFSMP